MIKIDFFKLTPRLGRIEHLGLFSFWFSVLMIGASLDANFQNHGWFTVIPMFVLLFIGFINLIFIKIRRLNDFNYSGWWILLGGIPFIGPLWILAIFCIPGTYGNNRYGAAPSNPSCWHYVLISAAPLIISLIVFGVL